MSARRGFTLIELLVVIAIISALAGMSLAGLSILRRQQKVAGTLDLMTHITTAIDQYLRDYQRLGNVPQEFLDDPWYYFFKLQHRAQQKPLLELPLERLVTMTSAGACTRAESPQKATHITDFWGNNPGNVFSFVILNNSKGTGSAFSYAQCILLRSSAGTPSEPKDDLILGFNSEKASWRKLRIEDLEEFAKEIDR
ncbi:MAG TPA: type II secretion system protein, partial [Planctomycetota bacterium]|nr:type II secretion system protein [Planctomycetota bacterium]